MMPQKEFRVSFVNISFKLRKTFENSQTKDAFDTPGIPKPPMREKPKPLIAIM